MSYRIFSFLTLFVLAGCGGSSPSTGGYQSAVAFTEDVQSYGYCYDANDANLCAEKYCSEGSGLQCHTRYRSAEPGYYTIALGDRGWGVGFSSTDREAAGKSAMNQCREKTQGCRLVETWRADGVE